MHACTISTKKSVLSWTYTAFDSQNSQSQIKDIYFLFVNENYRFGVTLEIVAFDFGGRTHWWYVQCFLGCTVQYNQHLTEVIFGRLLSFITSRLTQFTHAMKPLPGWVHQQTRPKQWKFISINGHSRIQWLTRKSTALFLPALTPAKLTPPILNCLERENMNRPRPSVVRRKVIQRNTQAMRNFRMD